MNMLQLATIVALAAGWVLFAFLIVSEENLIPVLAMIGVHLGGLAVLLWSDG